MSTRPNIVLLVNDHQAYYRHGWDSGVKPLRPHFDRLASEGINFERSYCAVPLCGPARRTLLTGLYPHNHNNYYNYTNAPYDHEVYLDTLADGGYRSYYFGKWHAGPGTALDHGAEGFSCENYGNPYITATYQHYLEQRGLPLAEHFVEGFVWIDEFIHQFPNLRKGIRYRCDSFWCGENAYGVTLTPKETHESFFLANLACDALSDLARSPDGRPFALRVDFWGPHPPYFPTQEFIDLYNPAEIQPYGSFHDTLADKPAFYRTTMRPLGDDNYQLISPNPLPADEWQRILTRCYAHISMIDAAGGLILDKLDELGLADNTLVIWTSDHGDAVASHGGQWDKGSYMTEEVMRVPLAIRYPGRIAPGQTSDKLVSSIDIVPTILDAAGLRLSNRVDGSSLLPVATGEADDWRDDLMAETHGHGWGRYLTARAIYAGQFKYIANVGHTDELYDLENDPYELINLINDPSYSDVLWEMQARLHAWQERTQDPDTVVEMAV